jgi:hypothetical protein
MKTLQVTIGAGVTQFTTKDIPARQIIVQNNAAHVMRVGDVNTTSSVGASLAAAGTSPGGSLNLGPFYDNPENLKEWWVAGTQNDVLDVIYTD